MKNIILSLALLLSSLPMLAATDNTDGAQPLNGGTRASFLQTDIVPYLEERQESNILQSAEDVLAAIVQPALRDDVRVGSVARWESQHTLVDSPVLVDEDRNMSGVFLAQADTVQANLIGTIGVAKKPAEEIAAAVTAVQAATSNATPSRLVKRNADAEISARNVTVLHQDYADAHDDHLVTQLCVDDEITGMSPKVAVKAMSFNDTPTFNVTVPLTIDGVALVQGDRILLNGQADKKDNGIWVIPANGGDMTRPTELGDFAEGSSAQGAFVLTTSGTLYKGTGWFCGTSAVIGTDNIEPFVLFSMPDQTTARNIAGTGTFGIFTGKTGDTLRFKGVAPGTRVNILGGLNRDEVVSLASTEILALSPGTLEIPTLRFSTETTPGFYRNLNPEALAISRPGSSDQLPLAMITTVTTMINNMLHIADNKYVDLPIATDEIYTYSIWTTNYINVDVTSPQKIIVRASNTTGTVTVNLIGDDSSAPANRIVSKEILVIRQNQGDFGTSANQLQVRVNGASGANYFASGHKGALVLAYWIGASGTTPAMPFPLFHAARVYNK